MPGGERMGGPDNAPRWRGQKGKINYPGTQNNSTGGRARKKNQQKKSPRGYKKGGEKR